MREQIDSISKQVEKIKEIAFTNKEHLDFEDKNLTQGEIEKIREAQKTTQKITSYNIIDEYRKIKKINKIIRILYLFTIVIVIGFLIIITGDYIGVKVENEKVKTIQNQKDELEKQTQILKSDLEQFQEKNNSLSSLIKEKDTQIEELKKSVNNDSKINKTQTITEEIKEELSQSGIIDENKTITEKIQENKEIKKCISTTTITINVRDSVGLNGKVLSFLDEGTEVEVLKVEKSNDRFWYQIKTTKITGWISSVGIEEFDNTCLK